MPKSKMRLNEVYFWTNTIKDWKILLKRTHFKIVIIETFQDLVERGLVKIYAFVIMPNHIHVIWEMLKLNGKEMPHASFNKATSHLFVRDLKNSGSPLLNSFKVKSQERQHRIWQRDALAVRMDDIAVVEQKIDYIHLNPLQEKWSLVKYPEDYEWSSANYYENNDQTFDFLTHYKDRF